MGLIVFSGGNEFNMIKLFFVLSLMLLNSCGTEGDKKNLTEKQSQKKVEQEREKKDKEKKAQEKAQFKSLAECIKAKSGGAKPTAEMIKQCLSSSS